MTGARVLLVDDDPAQIQVLKMFLVQQGYEIYTSLDGTEAVNLATQIHPDIILLDVCLPDMDGYAACQKMREFTSAPVIFISVKCGEPDVIQGFKSGADDYVSKPIRLHELSQRMESRMRNASQLPSINIYRDKSLFVDLRRKLVMRNGNLVHLTPLEFKLLVCLVHHAGEVVSHKVILKEVWGHCYLDGVTNLSLYIHYLREKLEDDPEHPVYIRSEWGSGYWFSVQNEEPI
ncbi:MAG TPA: DNA-binding response regulator [Anaerolineaceae bacterium]|nr:DNA-binding response regulator [Anaerolineaceae bacterium]